jgi:hypothetical protein
MHDESSPGYAHAAEEWRPVPGYEGRYEVSDLGRVRSLRFRNRSADIVRPTPRVLRPVLNSRGYFYVTILPRVRQIHGLVLEAFVGPCPPGYEGSHLNGHAADNRLVNLVWETRSENNRRKVEHGTFVFRRGEQASNAKLTGAAVSEIRRRSRFGESGVALAREFGVTQGAVWLVVAGRNWKHVPEETT